MIDTREIDNKSEELGVHSSHVQRDYVFGWLLAGLFEAANPLHDRLILKGGNAFRKAFFSKARYSNDLDFSTQVDLDDQTLGRALIAASDYAAAHSGVDFSIQAPRIETRRMADSDARMHEARVYFRSFYGDETVNIKVALDVVEFDTILLPVQTRSLIHDYSDANTCKASIRSWKLEELLAGKLKAMIHRQHSPDLYDFVHALFVQRALEVNRLEIVSTLLRKTIYASIPHVLKTQLLEVPFQVLRGLWNEYLVCPRESSIPFDRAHQHFLSAIPELFALLVPQPEIAGAYGAPLASYLGSGHRATIIEAGRLRRVLRIVYHGMARLVEPYALAFKRKKDGLAREYFYAWDLSGGHSGATTIKSFFADQLESVQATEDTFEPRYPIELVKSDVGFFSSSTFSGPGTYGWRPVRASRAPNRGVNYTIRCPYCGKTFKRQRMDTRLNDHKDQYGNKCFGRVGTFV